jgi:hypothetical protein
MTIERCSRTAGVQNRNKLSADADTLASGYIASERDPTTVMSAADARIAHSLPTHFSSCLECEQRFRRGRRAGLSCPPWSATNFSPAVSRHSMLAASRRPAHSASGERQVNRRIRSKGMPRVMPRRVASNAAGHRGRPVAAVAAPRNCAPVTELALASGSPP